ncbi:UDP-glucose 4-epimerase GalE [Sphingomonas sp. NSE70-1]|uniref:UDP-glucose 4-epimerase n=1 Tax=Sphingomonas caseinilyticus TaxID=2908205 RepID=A0ABT0RVQ6_9SPHN|nr:UDP-glucose 4-epimerase GalE [Sphingomonas caseinilyticus]MCL6698896.1 UDP-glucose 4-epimerase GalE [Sphingomonas caseinilyticus]
MNILLTGGAGYIGSHVAVSLLQAGHTPIIFDNFCNSSPSVADQLNELAGKAIKIVRGDIRDAARLRDLLGSDELEAVVHLAGLKAVSESIADPLSYYTNNVAGTLALLGAMEATGVRKIVFSSSATVYGEPQYLPIDEKHPKQAVNPYGQTKLICEQMMSDLAAADTRWQVSFLRYFNPIGAHDSGLIGEDPTGIPNNLMPLVLRTALGERDCLQVFGNDYPTPDGTAVRDYIHVVDLADGHVAALDALGSIVGAQAYNLGTGHGTSVLELLRTFEHATGAKVNHAVAARRPGDVATLYASADEARAKLNWTAKRRIEEMCVDSWRYATRNRRRG